MIAALLAPAEGSVPGTCTSNHDCSYNGRCDGSACVCSPEWTGPRCETLRLLPARKDTVAIARRRSPHATTPADPTSILLDAADGKWHIDIEKTSIKQTVIDGFRHISSERVTANGPDMHSPETPLDAR